MPISKAFPLLLLLLLLNIDTVIVVGEAEVESCPRDKVKFGVCGSWLGLVREVIGTAPSEECCSLIKGVADLEAAMCLCTALKADLVGLPIAPSKIPLALTLILNSCHKNLPQGFLC